MIVPFFVQKVAEEEEDADNDFWRQDFFAEENADTDYSAESDDKDSVDEDFDDAESEGNDDNTEEAIRSVLKLKKPKQLPPGYRQAALRKAAQQRAKRQRDQAGQQGDDGTAPAAVSSRRSSKDKEEGVQLLHACTSASCYLVQTSILCVLSRHTKPHANVAAINATFLASNEVWRRCPCRDGLSPLV